MDVNEEYKVVDSTKALSPPRCCPSVHHRHSRKSLWLGLQAATVTAFNWAAYAAHTAYDGAVAVDQQYNISGQVPWDDFSGPL